jgi:hypothetical protein
MKETTSDTVLHSNPTTDKTGDSTTKTAAMLLLNIIITLTSRYPHMMCMIL